MKNIIKEFGKVIIVALVIISIIGVTAGLSINNNSVVKSSITNLIKGLPDSGGLNNSGGNSSGGNTSGGNSGSNVDYGEPKLVGDLSATTDDNVKFTLYDSGVGVINGSGNAVSVSHYDAAYRYIMMRLCGYDNFDEFSDWLRNNGSEAFKDQIIQTNHKFNKLIIEDEVNFPYGLTISQLPINDLEIRGNVTAPFLEITHIKDLQNINISNSVAIESFAGFGNADYAPTIDNIDFLQNDSFKYCKGLPDGYNGRYASHDYSYLGNVVNITIPDKFTSETFKAQNGFNSVITKNIVFGKNFKSYSHVITSSSIETIKFKADSFLFDYPKAGGVAPPSRKNLTDIYLPANVNATIVPSRYLFKTNRTAIIHCPNEQVKEFVLANGAAYPDNVVID